MAKYCVVIALLVLTFIACVPDSGIDADGVAQNNRGVALMGRFDYEGALQEFAALNERLPENDDVLVNVAIATLNRQKEGDEHRALELLQIVLTRNSDHLRALYCSALLHLQLGEPELAKASLGRVVELDEDDFDAAYFLGQSEMQLQHPEEALAWYRRAIEGDPYLRSAHYRGFQALQRLRKVDEAKALLDNFRRLEQDPRARLVEFKYTKMGAKAAAMTLDQGDRKTKPLRIDGPIFEDSRDFGPVASKRGSGPSTISVCDLDHDGQLDIFLTDARDDGSNVVLTKSSEGVKFADAEDHPLAGVSGVNAALWGDIDNDGLVDVFFCRTGPNELWRQDPLGVWTEIGAQTMLMGEAESVDGALFDADHDGDLDIFVVNKDSDNELINNNRDGSFRALGKETGLSGSNNASKSVITTDVDNDRDLDLVLINAQPPHEVWLNDLQWNYHRSEVWSEFEASDINSAVSADLDADGRPEFYVVDAAGSMGRWRQDGNGLPVLAALQGSTLGGDPHLAVGDIDGDGVLEILGSGDDGWFAARVDQELLETVFEEETTLQAWSLANLEISRGPSLIAWTAEGLLLWPPGDGRYPSIEIAVSGLEDGSGSMRSNASGIGARIAVRSGSKWTIVSQLRFDSGPGQSLQPVSIGIGEAHAVDFVAIDWSDGVLQTELDLAPGSVHRIAETQRQLSSCPVLFAWDGQEYAFVSDLLGVGGIGFAIGPPDQYGEPRPHERLMLPDSLLKPKNGRLVLKLGEPMEEVTYLDKVALTAYDLPEGWSMTLDERMGILGTQPTSEPRFFRREVQPVSGVNDRGEDVKRSVRDMDLIAAPVGEIDHRFIGRLAQDHVLILVFDEVISRPGAMLVADGWVEYPYSQTIFAAWQAGADYEAASVEARAEGGEWKLVHEQFGYPAGMPRQMSLPLEALPNGTVELRISTNQEIYWDRLSVAFAEQPISAIDVHELRLSVAELQQSGYALRTTGDQRLPDYDYSRRSPLWDIKYLAGFYTRFGPVSELVASTDSGVAIFGGGEEIHMEFFEAPKLATGKRRVYVLLTDGWCKDMDLYTKDGSTIEPMPRLPGAPEQIALNDRFNTRYLGGRE